ncbi:MAG TPA: hypothetical protein VM578_13775 [Candidatus Saccharimonadales bacterium]|nr:hypothetical protein [Candidatus Saccharimonadales bacterium]
MENQDNKITNDVLHFENHSKLSATEIEKAVKRHNREHKGDAQKAATQAKAPAKRR